MDYTLGSEGSIVCEARLANLRFVSWLLSARGRREKIKGMEEL